MFTSFTFCIFHMQKLKLVYHDKCFTYHGIIPYIPTQKSQMYIENYATTHKKYGMAIYLHIKIPMSMQMCKFPALLYHEIKIYGWAIRRNLHAYKIKAVGILKWLRWIIKHQNPALCRRDSWLYLVIPNA